jgi:hypothetical protein
VTALKNLQSILLPRCRQRGRAWGAISLWRGDR